MRIEISKNVNIWLGISALLVAVSIVFMFAKGLNYGIDFSGGNIFQLKFGKEIKLDELNPILDELSKKYSQLEGTKRRVQVSEGNVLLMRITEISEEAKEDILSTLKEKYAGFEIMKVEKVGAVIGRELKSKALFAVIIGSILIVGYITMRFEFKYALAAVIALIHDIIISIGAIAILGYEVNTPFIAAVLTILGYSINDTIVAFDRVRENSKKMAGSTLSKVIDESVSQVMIRSLNTSITTLFAVIVLLVFGGATLKTFVVTLLVGLTIGTYSSLFVASALIVVFEKKGWFVSNKKPAEVVKAEAVK